MIDNNTVLRLIFGFKLRYLRLAHKKSYAELSEETGLSTSYLNDIEKGKKYPKPDKAALLAKCFDITYDEIVSTKSDKKIQPIIDFISSDFFKVFPVEEFGMSLDKILDVFTNSPVKTNAFISTILKMVRSYQIGQEDFYRVALRSYQDINNNYFPEIEEAANQFLKDNSLGKSALEAEVKRLGISIDYDELAGDPALFALRSYFDANTKKLFLNNQLDDNQIQFLLLKELAFHQLNVKERPYETLLNREVSFEKLLANFKAAYFAIACMIPKDQLVEDIKKIALETHWDSLLFEGLLKKYDVTPEMLMQRLTNVLPHEFGVNDLFFIKLKKDKEERFQMTKELHLSRIHNPYSNQLNEHLCQRWVSVTAINELQSGISSDGQISEYLDHENRYLCITLAQSENFAERTPSSVTIGLLITPELRANFNFLKDEKLRRRVVHTTCERCPLPNCEERVAEPVLVQRKEREEQISEALGRLATGH